MSLKVGQKFKTRDGKGSAELIHISKNVKPYPLCWEMSYQFEEGKPLSYWMVTTNEDGLLNGSSENHKDVIIK